MAEGCGIAAERLHPDLRSGKGLDPPRRTGQMPNNGIGSQPLFIQKMAEAIHARFAVWFPTVETVG